MCKLMCGLALRQQEFFIHDPGDESAPGATGEVLATQLENVVNLNTLLKGAFETVPKGQDATPWPNDDVLVLDLFVPDPPLYLRPAKYEYVYLLPCGQGRDAIVKASTAPVVGGTAAGAKA